MENDNAQRVTGIERRVELTGDKLAVVVIAGLVICLCVCLAMLAISVRLFSLEREQDIVRDDIRQMHRDITVLTLSTRSTEMKTEVMRINQQEMAARCIRIEELLRITLGYAPTLSQTNTTPRRTP